jgi:hypothetical protein
VHVLVYRVRLLVVLLIFFLEEENLGMADVRVILLLWANNLSMSCCTRQKRPMELLTSASLRPCVYQSRLDFVGSIN